MAYEDFEDEPRTAEEMLGSVRKSLAALEERVIKVSETLDDTSAGLRRDMAQQRREIVELRSSMARLQGRFDNQLAALALANIASGVGVAALVLGAAHVFS